MARPQAVLELPFSEIIALARHTQADTLRSLFDSSRWKTSAKPVRRR